MASDFEANQSSPFLTGFTIGLFAGAAGYYLFGTKKGALLRQKLVEEWEGAKHTMAEEGMIERQDVSLREFVRDLFTKASTQVNEVRKTLPESLVKKNSRSTSSKKDSHKRFRGV